MNAIHRPRWRPSPFLRLTFALHVGAAVWFVAQPAAWRLPLALVVANHLLLTAIGLWPRSTWLGNNWLTLPRASAARGEIALTIDDGPDPIVTPQVLDLLDRHQVKATFFCVGEKAARHPALCRDIVQRGHTIENHSQHHRHHFSVSGYRRMLRELRTAQETLTHITGRRPQFFRAPAGLRNPFLDPVLHALDLRLAAWTRRGFDTRVSDAGKVLHRLLPAVHPGAILLIHDGNCARSAQGVPVILDVLPPLIAAARERQLRFVTLSSALMPTAPVQ